MVDKPEFPSNYEQCEGIARKFRRLGLNAVCAVEFEHHCVQHYGESYYLLYPFIEGQVLKARSVTSAHATKMGEIFSQLHAIKSEGGASWERHAGEEWEELLSLNRPIIDDDLAGQIGQWNKQYQQVIPYLDEELVVSHRDLHYGNVIWDQKGEAHLVDWESAGVINPNVELIGYGLEWSGVLLGTINKEIFKEIIRSYERHSQKKFLSFKEAYEGWLGHCLLPWLFFNLRRIQGLVSADPQEIERGRAVLQGGLLKSLYFLKHHQKNILSTN